MRRCSWNVEHQAGVVREATGEMEKGQIKKGPNCHKTESGFCPVGTGEPTTG